MLIALTIAGGVALLLYAVRFLRKGLDRLFGIRLESGMQRMCRTPARAFLAGIGTSFLAPSSTTVSLLAVQTVQAGHLSPRRTLTVMLGANVGLTLMVQLVALHMEQWAPLLILAGVLLYQFTVRSMTRGIGQVLLALGFLFMAIGIMKGATASANLAANDDFRKLIELAGAYPLILAIVAAALTMCMQSSTATIALVIGVAGSGLMSLQLSMAVVLGANAGMSLTTLIVGWNQVESRRLAMGNAMLKISLAAILLLVVTVAGSSIPELAPEQIGFWVAQSHTGYNILLAAVGLPLADRVSAFCEYLIPAPPEERTKKFGPKFVHNGPIGSVALALGQSMREIMHASEIVRGMLDDVWIALRDSDEHLANQISERDDQVDLLEMKIKKFLTRIVREESNEQDADEQLRQLRYLSELETVGDIIDKNLVELVQKRIRKKVTFSEEGWSELQEFHRKVQENFLIADSAFTTRDETLAHQLLRHKQRINRLEESMRDRHFERLNAGQQQSHETSAIHLDLLTNFKRINSALTHVAYAILRDTENVRRAATPSAD